MYIELIIVAFLCLATCFAPVRYTAVLLGILLPIDVIRVVTPVALDVARYGLLALLVLRLAPEPRRGPRVMFALSMSGLIVVSVFGLVKGASGESYSLVRGVVGLASTIGGVLVARRMSVHRHVLVGFVLGSVASACDVCLQVAGLPYLGVETLYGFRYSGFSLKSTALAPLLALAIVLVASSWLWTGAKSHRFVGVLRVVMLAPLGFALYASQGRGGLVSLILAGVFLTALRFRGHPGRVITLLGLTLVAAYYFRAQITDLFVRPSENDLSNGRGQLNEEALRAFARDPLFGATPSEIPLLNPHTPLLTFAIEAGLLGLAAALVLMIALLRVVSAKSPSSAHVPAVVRAAAVVMLVTSFLEPDGFYVGLGRVVLLGIVLTNVAPTEEPTTVDDGARRRDAVRSRRYYSGSGHRARQGS